MNRILFVLMVPFILISCSGKHTSETQKALISEPSNGYWQVLPSDTLRVHLSRSTIYWKGTKMYGAGKHQGEIKLKSGFFLLRNGQLEGGAFIADMKTIQVTDIPKHDPVPRNNLNDHLKSSDFFNVKKHPFAHFEIIEINNVPGDSIKVYGNLTIKDSTKTIVFLALYKAKIFSTTFTFDRFQWNIAYEGNLMDRTLVDRDIELKMALKME